MSNCTQTAKLGKKSPFLYRRFDRVCIYGVKGRKVGWHIEK